MGNFFIYFFFHLLLLDLHGNVAIIKSLLTRQSAQWGTYTLNQRYHHFLKSTKYVALTLEMAVVCYIL